MADNLLRKVMEELEVEADKRPRPRKKAQRLRDLRDRLVFGESAFSIKPSRRQRRGKV